MNKLYREYIERFVEGEEARFVSPENLAKTHVNWTKEKIREYVAKIDVNKTPITDDMSILNRGSAEHINYIHEYLEFKRNEILKELNE